MRFRATILFSLLALRLMAQENIAPTVFLGGGVTSGKYTPFWLRANQYGAVPTEESYGTVGMETRGKFVLSKRADWGYGLAARVNLAETKADPMIQEAYIKGRYGIFELQLGRKKQLQGLMDSTLSSGSYIWSGNALPMPSINLVVKDFWAPAFLKDVVGFKGNYSHGWFENSRADVRDFYLHQKSFYGRLGKPTWKVKFYGGFNHQVQWGGVLKYSDPNNFSAKNGRIASGPKEYLYMITGQSINRVKEGGDTATYGVNDGWNRLGNHLGTVDLAMELELTMGKLLMYRQSIYEDGSLYYGNNITDGLHGISFARKAKKGLQRVVVEYLNTASQGGNVFTNSSVLRGFDNYLNNGVYNSGWTYFGKGIGSPMLTLDSETDLASTKNVVYDNNRVEAYYVGIEGLFGENAITFRGSLSNAIGWFGSEYVPVKRQISVGVCWSRPIVLLGQEAVLKANVGFDTGSWKKDVVGGNVTLALPLP
jgi:hypothetical protein